MKKLLPMLLCLLVPAVSFGQGSIVNDIALKNLVTGIAPAAGATVTVCTSAGTGIPCTPLATVYSNVALTVQLTNPLTADSNGYYSFFAAAGTYIVTITGAGTSGRTITYTVPATLSSNNIYTGTITESVSPGTFTNTQMNQYVISNIGSLNFGAIDGRFNGPSFQTEAISGGIVVPNGVGALNQPFAAAVAGWGSNNNVNIPLFALNGQAECLVNNYRGCWGMDIAVRDATPLAAVGPLIGAEIDVDPQNNAANYTNGAVDGVDAIVNGVSGQTYSAAFRSTSTTGSKWSISLFSVDNTAVTAVQAGATCTSGSCASQAINYHSFAAGVGHTAATASDSTGDFVVTPDTGGGIRNNGFFFNPEIAAPVNQGAGFDQLWGDSTAHRWKMFNNGGSAMNVPGIASAGTAGNSVKLAANGIDLVDSGAPPTGFTSVNVTPVTVSANTTGDQNLMAITITAGALNSISRTLLIQLAGVYSTPAGSTAVLTHKLKLCTVSGCGSGTVITLATWVTTALGAIQVTNDPYNATLNATTQTAGASAAFEAHGNLTIDLAALAAAAESVFADNNTATVGTIDSTAQLFLQHTVAFSAGSASNTDTDRQMIADTVD